ncbi:MAG: HAD hydrolase-like protein [bacterium]
MTHDMLIIFDLDYTLLDTLGFKKGLAEALNLEFDVYHENCKKHFKDTNILYNLEKHLKILEQENSGVKIKDDFFSSIGSYLFPEAEDILKKMKNAGHKLVLLTYGDVKWQKQKVENLKIKKYFDEIIYTDKKKSKTEELRDFLIKNAIHKFLIVNDNAKECLEIKEVFEECEIFLVKGRYSENAEHDFEIRELVKILDL